MYGLVGFLQNLYEVSCHWGCFLEVCVASPLEEGDGLTSATYGGEISEQLDILERTSTASTSNTMYIVFHISREVIVDDQIDVRDVCR